VGGCATLHEQHQQEAGEILGTALQHGTYSKVPEFVDFKERLQHSHARALAAIAQTLASSGSCGGGDGKPASHVALQHVRQLLVAGAVAGAADKEAAASCSDGAGGPQLRFNEDLTTRPSWYPPGSAGSGALADWWQQQQQQQRGQQHPGYAHCWWAEPLAAEGPHPEAARWRRRCQTELHTRVAWALITSDSLASPSDAAALLEQLQPLLAAPRAGAAAEQAAAGMALQAAGCKATMALVQALDGSSTAGAEAAMHELAQACNGAGKQLAAELAGLRGLAVMPGGPMTAAAAAVADSQALAAVCTRLQRLAATAAGLEATAAAAGKATETAEEAAKCVRQAAAALLQALGEPQMTEQALQLLSECGSGGSGSEDVLWGFEPALQVQPAVAALVQAQMAVLQGMLK
jgi:N-terminal acetyltransferase B complex non-catalytic subunit